MPFREHAPARDAAEAVQKVLIHTEIAFPGGDALRDRRISRDADTRRGQTQRGLGGEGDTSDTNDTNDTSLAGVPPPNSAAAQTEDTEEVVSGRGL